MPDLKDSLRHLNLLGNTTTPGTTNNTPVSTDPNGLTAGDIALFKSIGADKLFNTLDAGRTNTGWSNPNFDPDRTDINQQISNSGFQNWYNTFRRAWLDMNISTEIGKMNLDAGEFGQGTLLGISQSAEEIIDNYTNDIKALDTRRETGQITEAEYLKESTKLQEDFNRAQQVVSESNQAIAEAERSKNDYVVSNRYAAKTARALQKGDDLGIIENIQYALPQTFGSSASLMIPQMAAAFGAGFVKSAAGTVAGTLGAGSTAAPIIGTIAGVGSALATLVWGRAQESYGEVGGLIQEAREKMLVDYMRKNNIQDPSQVPEDVMANIRAKSRKGSEMLFKENMALAIPDVASALLLPMNTLGKTMGISVRGSAGKVGQMLSNAKNYNLWTKGLAFAANRRYAQYLEQFEEGTQYAATDRAKDEIYDLGEYENKGFIKNLLDDSYNTVASLNYTLLPGITPSLRGSGKYALDPEFQASDNSGALLALAMSAPTSALSIGKELMAYRNSKRDIINQGLFDVDSKFERLNASLLKSYFEKGQTGRLLEAIKVVGRQQDEEGNPYYTEAQGTKAINDIKELYKAYSNISDNLDNITKDKLFGFKSSREQKNMMNLVKEDLFTFIMNLKRQSELLPELNNQYAQALEQEINTGSEDINLATLKDLKAKQEVITELLNTHAENSEISSRTAPKNIVQNLKDILEEVNVGIQQEESKLTDLGIDFKNISEPSFALKEANKNLYVQQEYTKEQRSIYNELSKIKSQKDLVSYINKNKNRVNLEEVAERITGTETNNPVSEVRTNEEVIMDETEGYDPDPANQESGPTITTDFIDNLTNNTTIPEDEIYEETGNELEDLYNLNRTINNRNKRLFKESLESALADPNMDVEAVKTLMKDNGIDMKNTSFASTWDKLKEIMDSSDLLRDNFDTIKEMVLSEQTDSNLIKDTEDAQIDPITLDITGKSPFHNYNDSKVDDNNKKVQEDFKQALEANPAPGFKIIDPYSIANRQVGFEGRQDTYEQGKLVFNDSGDDQHITNTSIIRPGTQVSISIENPEVLNEIDVNTELDSELNKLQLGIFVSNTSQGITIPLKIGSVHTTDYYTIDTFDPTYMSIEDAKNHIRKQRKYILTELKKNPNTSFSDVIVDKGFGHLNLNQLPNTVRNVIGSDTRPYLTLVGDSGIPIQIGNKSTYQEIQGFEKGASMLMIPNDTATGTKYIPIYLNKQTISSDQNAFREVTTSIDNFLKGADNIWGKQLDDWLYVTRNPSEKRKLVNNGIVLENNKIRGQKSATINNITYSYNRNTNVYTIQGTSGNPIVVSDEEFYNGLNRQGISLPGLSIALGNLYPSLNKERLMNPKDTNQSYQKKMMNSSVYQTRVAPNTVLLDKVNDLYSFLPEGEQYQYFSQHTITLSGNIINESADTVIPEEIVITEPSESTPSELNTEEDVSDALGDDFIFDIDLQNPADLPSVKPGVNFVFEQNSELNQIGTPEQYSQYLNTIFPNSWNTNIMYRGVGEIRDDNFRDGVQTNEIRDWNFFTNNLGKAQDYGENIISAILNLSDLDNGIDFFHASATSPGIMNENSAFVVGQEGDEFVVKNREQIYILGSKQDIEGFRNFVGSSNAISFNLKTVENIQNNIGKVNNWFKQLKDTDTFWNKVQQDLQIPKEQISLLRQSEGNTIDEKLTNFLANYSYTIEINTAKEKYFDNPDSYDDFYGTPPEERDALAREKQSGKNSSYYSNLTVPGGTNYTENEIATPAITPSIKGHAQFSTDKGIGWFRSDDRQRVKGFGIYTKEQADKDLKEGKISQFEYEMASETFDVKSPTETDTKTRRILEVQSDLFQKSRGKEVLANSSDIKGEITNNFQYKDYNYIHTDGIYVKSKIGDENNYNYITEKEYNTLLNIINKDKINVSENQFLQLLNKGNNWVTFFIKSIIQDSAKKGYEKVLFPRLDTIIQIESQGRFKTYEEAEKFYKTPEWIKKNDKAKKALDDKRQELKDFKSKELSEIEKQYKQEYISKIEREIEELYENWHSLQPTLLNTAKFYENDVTNILDKQFKKNVSTITDEYGNTWNEVDLSNTNFNTSFSFDIDNNQSRQNITNQLKDKIYISDDMPYSVQQEVISSVAYMLLNNNPDTDTNETNSDRVKSDFESRFNKASAVLAKTNSESPAFEKLNNLVNYYRVSLDNWDNVVEKAKETLERIGFVSSDDTDYYDNLEESIDNTEESENVQFNDDSARTRNIVDFIPSEVKKLMSFIPAYRKLDPLVASDKAIIDSKNIEYTPEGNSLGLPYFNDFNDTWTKTLTLLSTRYFDSDRNTGWVKMINTLLDKANPIVVQELGRKLQAVPSKVQNAFYTSTNLQLQHNLTTKSELKDGIVDKVKSTQKTTRVIASDRTAGIKKISNQLRQEFNNSPSVDITIRGTRIQGSILTRAVDSITGKVINVINTDFGTLLHTELLKILKDDNSYLNYTKANGEIKRSNYFTPETQIDIYNLVLAAGINISRNAFNDFLKTFKADNSEIISPRATVQSIFESRIFKTLAGNSKRSSETDDTSKTDNDKNNPFVNDLSSINSLAYSEFKYRNNIQQGAFRQDGKSYYPFIRHHYLSEKFTNMTEKVNQNQDKSEFQNILTTDNFASTSMILQDIVVGQLNNLELDYELGSKLTNSESGVKLLKEMNEREHQITKMAMYQNSGNKAAYFFYDTLSDKSTMPIIKRNRIDVEYDFTNTSIDQGNIVLSDSTMNELYRYFEAEYKRIRKVQIENETLEADKKIKGYHNQGKKEGMGNKFLIYSFLNKAMLDVDNPELSALLFNDKGELKEINSSVANGVKQAINNHFNYIFQVNKEDMRNLGLFNEQEIYSLIDRNYLLKGNTNSIANKIGVVNNPKFKSFANTGNAKQLGTVDTNKIIDYAVVDYVVNYALKSNEMLQLTGDPAQMGKLEKISYKEESDKGTQIRNKYRNNPNSDLLEAKDILQLHINSTLVNVNKRNAAFLGSGSKGLFDLPEYNVAIANDIAINSNQVDEYKALFPDREDEIEDKYVNGDIADAQEFTTVKEHLNVMLAFAKLTPEQYRKGLYIYDRADYNNTYPGQTERLSQEEKENLFKIIFQPAKPVQRIGVLNAELQATKHYYIKTSSFPIFPDLVKGTPMEAMLNDMKANKVDRVAFVSGVKLGVAGAKDLFDKEGEYNSNFFTNNVNTLNRNGFRIQLEVPYKAGKDAIREGTQQAKIIFVDIDDNIDFTINGKKLKGSDLKTNYKEYHQEIFKLKRDELLDEIDASYDGRYKFNNLNKLADLLQREAIDRGYGLNSILGLDLNDKGRFKIPLTFSPVAGKIEPVITAIISNRLAKMKLPGHSYIQGSEFVLTTGKKGKIKSDEVLKDQRNIIWTNPKYANTTKLQYLREEDGTIKGAQIVIAPYFVVGGQKLDIKDFTTEIDGSTYIDTSRVDPTLLAMNGFRIPFQGHNSGMWFEIIGFLPQEAGDLAIVPGEIAAQMGSDYDVDKLYSYMYNYYYSGDKIMKIHENTTLDQINKNIERNRKAVENEMDISNISRDQALEALGLDRTEIKKVTESKLQIMKRQNDIIDIHQAVYTNKDLLTSILNPLSFDVVNQAISETEEFTPVQESEFTGIYDPLYQRTFYFSNKGGKLGTAISALANTSHAQAQITNLYIKGQGIVFEDANGNIYKDEGNNSNRTNTFVADRYQYEDPMGNLMDQNDGTQLSAWRLDKIYTFPDSKGRVFKISDLISQILGVSVDNAKEQVLGKFGINAQNFNTTLTIIRAGFDLVTVKKFITQPILQEYYGILDSLTDMYTIDYTADKKNKAIRELIDKYAKRYNLNISADRLLLRNFLMPTNVSRMEDALRAGEVNESNVTDQLEILKSYLQYSDISDNLQALNRAYNMDSRGLPKNISDTLKKEQDMIDISKSPYIGNINRYVSLSLPGVYSTLPWITTDLFAADTNPLFAYNSTTYRNINKAILEVTGRETLYSNQQDIVNNNIKQFIYTSFINTRENLADFKNKLLFDTEENKSLVTRFNELYTKYPRDKFLSSLDTITSIYPDNPKLIEIKMSSEDNYVQVVSEAWEYAYNQNIDIELKDFALDLFRYALAVSPQEFGTSSIVRYLPFKIMEDSGFTDYLDNTHNNLNTEGLASKFEIFTKQFLQHNPDFALSIRQESIEELYKAEDDKQNIVKSFKLPPVNSQNNKAQSVRRSDELGNFYYPQYLSFYTNPNIGKQVYEKIETPEGTIYFLLPKLGITNVTEYDLNQTDQVSMFEENKITREVFVDSSAIMDALRGSADPIFTYEDMDVMNATKLLSEPRTPENIINGLQAITSRYKNNEDSYLRKIGTYYNVLADNLAKLDYSDVTINYTQEGNSRTSGDGKTIFINTSTANNADNKSGLNAELNTVRVILHEMLHSAVFRKLTTSKKDFDLIEQVYDEYRTSIWDSKDTVRGVNKETFLGETLSTLLENYRNNQNSDRVDLDINSINVPANLTDERLRDLLNQISPKMKKLAQQGHINSNENLYNFSSDSDREQEFFKLIRDNFTSAERFRNVINKFYPYISIDEFITESTTNPQTQMYLKRIPGILERVRSVISDILRKLFGITSEERNLFQDSIDAVFNFISPEEIKQKEVSLPEAELDLGIETSESEDIDYTNSSIIQKILNLPCA